jgi:hypothetical protein
MACFLGDCHAGKDLDLGRNGIRHAVIVAIKGGVGCLLLLLSIQRQGYRV